MDSSAETKKTSAKSNKTIIAAAGIVAAAIVGVGVFVATRSQSNNDLTIGYAAEASVMLDQNSLQAAFDEAMRNAAEGNVGLQYKNDAFSDNGTDFECYIVNSDTNIFDMFLSIFADAEMTDQLFLSGLVPPGSGFENITLEHALDPGDHTVYVVLTQVETNEETGEQVIKNQITHTMDFHVIEQ